MGEDLSWFVLVLPNWSSCGKSDSVGGKSDSVSDSVCGKSDSVCGKVDRLRVSRAGGRLVVVCADFTQLVLVWKV
jgi:hypothetical protein